MMHLLWYLQNNLFVPENTILQIRLFAFIVYFFSTLSILLCSQPAEQAGFRADCVRCFVVYDFFFSINFLPFI